MYLSRVEINTKNRQKLKRLSHLGAYHNWVEHCFPQEFQNGQRTRHLWRLDRLHGREYLLLLSSDKPDLQHLGVFGVPGTAATKDYDSFLNSLANGMVMRFRLTANPSYRDRESGRVYPHVTVAQQKEWLAQRAAALGFEFAIGSEGQPQFDIVSRNWPRLFHGHRQVKLSCASFEGVLKITDVTKFRQALTEGIGREKAYGMGLLTVIPERR